MIVDLLRIFLNNFLTIIIFLWDCLGIYVIIAIILAFFGIKVPLVNVKIGGK